MSSDHNTPVRGGKVQTAYQHADTIQAYPEGEFSRSDLNEHLKSKLTQFRHANLISDERVVFPDGRGNRYWIYTVRERARDIARDAIDARDAICPCGHGGMRNLRDGGYQCAFELCEREFKRDDLEVNA